MNLTIGFCEIALVTSLFFFKQSWWIGVILLTVAIVGKIVAFALAWNDNQEKTKAVRDANENLTKSLNSILGVSKEQKLFEDKKQSSQKTKNKVGIPEFIFENYIDKKDKPN